MESTYIKRRSLEEIRTEDEIHILSSKLDQTREDIRSLSSKLGTWEELKTLSQELKLKERELDMRREIENELNDILEERLRIIQADINQKLDKLDSVESSITSKIREMGERICMALDQFTKDIAIQNIEEEVIYDNPE